MFFSSLFFSSLLFSSPTRDAFFTDDRAAQGRRFLWSLFVLGFLLALMWPAQASAQASEWTSHHHDAGRTRHNAAETELSLPLAHAWSTDLAAITMHGPPVVAGGSVYSFCSDIDAEIFDLDMIWSWDLCAFDGATGNLLWRNPIADYFYRALSPRNYLSITSLTWADGRLFFSVMISEPGAPYNYFTSVDAISGEKIWNLQLALHPGSGFSPLVSDPIPVGDKIVYVRSSNVAPNRQLQVLRAFDGQTFTHPYESEPHGCISGLVLGGRLIMACSGLAVAYNVDLGEVLWRVEDPYGAIAHRAVAHEGTDLLISLGSPEPTDIFARHGSNGTLAWTSSCPGRASDLVVSEDRIELLCKPESAPAFLMALDPASGDTLHEHEVDWSPELLETPHTMVKANGLLFVPSVLPDGHGLNDGDLLALDSDSGTVLWTRGILGSGGDMNPAIADGHLYFWEDGRLTALRHDPDATGQPDLVAGPISWDQEPAIGEPLQMRSKISNSGGGDVGNAEVIWRVDGQQVASSTIAVDAGTFQEASFTWTPPNGLPHDIEVEVDPADQVSESDESNNQRSAELEINPFQDVEVELSSQQMVVGPEGWYEAPNPLIATVSVRCPSSSQDPCEAPLHIRVESSSALQARFYSDETDAYEAPGAFCLREVTGDAYSYTEARFDCVDEERAVVSVPPGESQDFRVKLWIQPSPQSDLQVQASWSGSTDSDHTAIPEADIRPVVFVHGILGSMPPQNLFITDQGEMGRTIDPFLRSYYPLLTNLQKMGYSWNETLFAVAYDWRQSNRISGGFLAQHLPLMRQLAGDLDWADNSAVDIVAHSMGGLVTRAYIQEEAVDANGLTVDFRHDVGKVVFIASPHRGFPIDYRTREGMTWSDYLYGDGSIIGNSWQAILRWLVDDHIWPTLAAKHSQPEQAHIEALCIPWSLLWQDLLPGYGYVPTENGIYECHPEIVKFWTHDTDRGVHSLLEMLPTEDLGQGAGGLGPYLVDGSTPWPHGFERNDFLEELNASIHELVDGVGLEDLYVIYGSGAETDLQYDVDPPPGGFFWHHGLVVESGITEPATGDDLIPARSMNLEDLVGLPLGHRIPLNAAPSGSDGGARHKEIMFTPEVQKQWVPTILGGLPVSFISGRPPAPALGNLKALLTHCPVHLLVTDPSGRRAGFDPSTGTTYAEIPGAIATRPGSEPEIILLPEPEQGDYHVDVFAYDEGPYLVRSVLVTADGSAPLGSLAGNAMAGDHGSFTSTVEGPLPPVVADDEATTGEDQAVSIDVLANDYDPNAEAISITGAQVNPAHGQVTIADDHLIFTPASNFHGAAALTYVVADASGLETTGTVSITVQSINDPPVAQIDASNTIGPAPLTPSFDATGSFDIDGSIVSWHWQLGDGRELEGESIAPIYGAAGVYDVVLTVTDDEGASDTEERTLTVAGLHSMLFIVDPDPATGGLRPGDQAVADRLVASGYTVDWRAPGAANAEDALLFDLVLISSTPSSSAIGTTYRDVAVPVVTWEAFVLDDLGLTAATPHLDYGGEIDRTEIYVEPGHAFVPPELQGTLTVTSAPAKMTFGRAARPAMGVARRPDRHERLHFFGYEAGDPMAGPGANWRAPERRLALFLSDETSTVLTDEGWALFDAGICWALHCSGDALARFTWSQTDPVANPLTLELDGSFSKAGKGGPAATIVDWTWRIDDQPVDGEDQLIYDFGAAGRYLIELTVTDSAGRQNATSRWVTAGDPAYRALFVVGSFGLGAGDRAIAEMLETQNIEVELMGDLEAQADDATGKDLVLISSTIESDRIASTFRDIQAPVLTWEHKLLDDLALTGTVENVDYGRAADQTSVDIASSHPAAGGLFGVTALFDQASGAAWGIPTTSAELIATVESDPSKAAIFVIEAGDALIGHTAAGRRAALPYSDKSPWHLTEEGQQQFLALVLWAVSGN